MRSYWNFLLITILCRKMMKYKMFVNKVQQCDLANVTRGGSMRSYWNFLLFCKMMKHKMFTNINQRRTSGLSKWSHRITYISKLCWQGRGISWIGLGEWLSHPVIVLVFKSFVKVWSLSQFLAVQNSSISDLVTDWVSEWVTEWLLILTLQSDPRYLWPLRPTYLPTLENTLK